MTVLRIDTSWMPNQQWSISARPFLDSFASSPSLAAPRPQPSSSLRAEEAKVSPLPPSLDVQLFDNAAQLKIMLSQIAMHMSSASRNAIFAQLDFLLKLEDWQDDSALIEGATFNTFIRFLIFAAPNRLPSLGVGLTGHVLAAWNKGDQHISIEFLPNDYVTAILVKQGTCGKQAVSWRGHVVDFKEFVERFGLRECMNDEFR